MLAQRGTKTSLRFYSTTPMNVCVCFCVCVFVSAGETVHTNLWKVVYLYVSVCLCISMHPCTLQPPIVWAHIKTRKLFRTCSRDVRVRPWAVRLQCTRACISLTCTCHPPTHPSFPHFYGNQTVRPPPVYTFPLFWLHSINCVHNYPGAVC